MLDYLGGECSGAVSFNTSGQTPSGQARDDIQWLSDDEFLATMDEITRHPMLASDEGVRFSLAGAQVKLPVVFDDSVLNECFCLNLAEAMQLRTAKAVIVSVKDQSFFVVQRYDRLRDTSNCIVMLHQEDFCQVLGVEPENKYQNEGGPSLVQCFELLRRATVSNSLQVFRLLDGVAFNALVGNHDAHGKNFSLLYTKAGVELAPLYNVLSTAVYPQLTRKMAMKIGRKYIFDETHPRHWMEFTHSVGLPEQQAVDHLLALAKKMPAAARQLQSNPCLPFQGSQVVEQIVSHIQHRCEQTIRRFS